MNNLKNTLIIKEARNDNNIIKRNDILEPVSFQELSNVLGGNNKDDAGTIVVGKNGFFCSCHTLPPSHQGANDVK